MPYNKEYYQRNKDAFRARMKRWEEKNIDRVKANRKRYYEENKEKISEKTKKYYYNNIEKMRLATRKSMERYKSPKAKEWDVLRKIVKENNVYHVMRAFASSQKQIGPGVRRNVMKNLTIIQESLLFSRKWVSEKYTMKPQRIYKIFSDHRAFIDRLLSSFQ